MQIKAKYFVSVTQFHRALADNAASKYGDALVRFQFAETAAKEVYEPESTISTTLEHWPRRQ